MRVCLYGCVHTCVGGRVHECVLTVAKGCARVCVRARVHTHTHTHAHAHTCADRLFDEHGWHERGHHKQYGWAGGRHEEEEEELVQAVQGVTEGIV